jgi:hypothetical protein
VTTDDDEWLVKVSRHGEFVTGERTGGEFPAARSDRCVASGDTIRTMIASPLANQIDPGPPVTR